MSDSTLYAPITTGSEKITNQSARQGFVALLTGSKRNYVCPQLQWPAVHKSPKLPMPVTSWVNRSARSPDIIILNTWLPWHFKTSDLYDISPWLPCSWCCCQSLCHCSSATGWRREPGSTSAKNTAYTTIPQKKKINPQNLLRPGTIHLHCFTCTCINELHLEYH